jgi:hypothetical protein
MHLDLYRMFCNMLALKILKNQLGLCNCLAYQWLARIPRFDPLPVQVGFVMEKVLGQVYLQVLPFLF